MRHEHTRRACSPCISMSQNSKHKPVHKPVAVARLPENLPRLRDSLVSAEETHNVNWRGF